MKKREERKTAPQAALGRKSGQIVWRLHRCDAAKGHAARLSVIYSEAGARP
jgi:hypothetical protein